MAPFSDVYHLRKVGPTAAKSCTVCFKPTSDVLVSEDGKSDYFYVCSGHLTDPGFAVPQPDPEVEQAKVKKAQLMAQIEALKKEWAKKNKKEKKDKADKEEKGKRDSSPAESSELTSLQAIIDRKPRVFTLNRTFYSMRIENWKSVQRAKQVHEMLANDKLFPKPPTGFPASTNNDH